MVKLISFQNSVILSKFDKKFSKVNQVIYSLAPISIPNMKALAQILFEISCTQDFQDFFSKGDNSERGHNSEKKKIRVIFFFMRNPFMKFQDTSIHRLKVKKKWCGHTDTRTHGQAQSNMPYQLFQSWGHNHKAIRTTTGVSLWNEQ